jgi:hypothetical protein
MFEGPILWAIGTAVFTGGVAWGSVRHSMNGQKVRLEKVEVTSADNSQRLVRVETKIDILVDRST